MLLSSTSVARSKVEWVTFEPACQSLGSLSRSFEGPDRNHHLARMETGSGGEFRVRTGDRYLGGQVWEHYLGFEQYRASVKPIKLSMIRLRK